MPNGLEISADADTWIVLMVGEAEGASIVPHQVKVLTKRFGVRRRDRGKIEPYLTAMLTRIAVGDDSPLPFRLVRWSTLDEQPFIISFGAVPRSDDELEVFLAGGDDRASYVEPVVLEDVTAPQGKSIRRSLAQSQQGGELFSGVRYVVDTGDPDGVGLIYGGNTPERVAEALADVDEVARGMYFAPV